MATLEQLRWNWKYFGMDVIFNLKGLNNFITIIIIIFIFYNHSDHSELLQLALYYRLVMSLVNFNFTLRSLSATVLVSSIVMKLIVYCVRFTSLRGVFKIIMRLLSNVVEKCLFYFINVCFCL